MVDASFWINAERSGLVPYLLDYFRLAVPPRVAEELTTLLGQVSYPPPAAVLFAEWHERGLIEITPPQGSYSRFDAGENEAIALARERGWVLLIDNSAPRDYSRGPLRLRVVDSPAFAVFLYDQGRLSFLHALTALQQSRAARRVVREASVLLRRLARLKGDVT